MTHDHIEDLSPAHVAAAAARDLMAALRDDALADLGSLHLMFLLDTKYWCRFSYLRDALRLTDDRLRRHIRLLRSHGYAATSRDTTGTGWAYLTPLGAARRDAQFAAVLELPAAARGHVARTRASQPEWFIRRGLHD